MRSTDSGLELEPVYRDAGAERDYVRDLGDPGTFPYTRGPYRDMYRGRLWTMRQYAGFGSAEDTNRRFRFLLERGQTGLSVAFDLPTQMGYDAAHPLARGEVGRVGVSISTLRDMEILFDGIPLDRVSTSMTINATAPILLAMYVAVGEQQSVPSEQLRGTVQNDILKEYIARGTYIYPPGPSLALATDVIAFAARSAPRYHPISISGYHIREAGATAIQELAFTLANGQAYVEAAIARGLDVDEFAPRLSFFFNAQNDLLEEVAKFRAARRMWARIMRERFGARDPRSHALRFHAQTAGSSLTASQVDVNVVRVTVLALAAALGGAQSIHTNSKDEALGLPTEEAAALALRTQQVLAHESGITATADPLGGSFAVEALTDRLEAEALGYLERIDDMGGALTAIESGFIVREIEESAYRHQKQIESGERVVIGVNAFRSEGEVEVPALVIDAERERAQIERLQRTIAERDRGRVDAALARLETAARAGQETIEVILECVRAYASVGEIADALRRVHGEYRPGG